MLGSKTTLAVVRELSLGILGRGEGGLKGTGVSGSGYNEVPALGVHVCVYMHMRLTAGRAHTRPCIYACTCMHMHMGA